MRSKQQPATKTPFRQQTNKAIAVVNGRCTWGRSLIASPWGEVLGQHAEGEGVVLAECNWHVLQQYRQQLPALQHRVLDVREHG